MENKATLNRIRQPIVTVCGHVDHGKTSILDCFRNSSVQEGEAGGITQKISFTSYSLDQLKKACPLIEKSGIKLDIQGFLLIDTPGHAAFTNLRKRGGSLADLAILAIDINEGIKPQTSEVIQILKHNKTPFIIALNKIDNISGWKTDKKNNGIQISIEGQPLNVKQIFDERYMTIIGSLHSYGFDSDLFYNITDFTKKIALVPCSARTKEGIPELIMVLCGLSQKYLADKLLAGKTAKGVILEIKTEKSISYAESILYDGELSKKDEIAVASFYGEPLITKIRVLEEIEPLSNKFRPKEKVIASTGLRMQFSEKIDVLPGMPFVAYAGNLEEIKNIFKKEISDAVKSGLSKQGIIAKADSLGSLEALLVLLKQENIPAMKAGIGGINKSDIISAKANLGINRIDALVVGFNVPVDEDAKELASQNKINVLTDDVVYKLMENSSKWRDEKRREIEKERMMSLFALFKIKILNQYVFRNTNPAIFGVRVEAGKLKPGIPIFNKMNERIGKIKNLQSENRSIEEASEGMEVAVSVPNVNFERQLKDESFLYSDISESQFKNFKKNKDLLSEPEMKILQEIAEIKRIEKIDWGVTSK